MSLSSEPIPAPPPRAQTSAPPQDAASGTAQMAPGATYANWFNLFNAFSWQITLGAPIILYAKGLGASATLLGLIASLMPLLVIFQIPAANWLPRYGYRRFIMAGWTSRTVTIFGVAVVPLLTFASAGAKLAIVFACLFLFNLLRGVTAGAWWPWICELVPQPLRGRFLSRDQFFIQIGSLVAIALAALVLQGNPQPWQFTAVFLISATGATASLVFLKRMPDVTAPEKLRTSTHRVPWKQMLLYPPFFRLTVFTLLYFAVNGGLGVFPIAYLKGQAHYRESTILALAMLWVLGAMLTVRPVGRFVDRRGSKPMLLACLLAVIAVVGGWWTIAAGLVSASPALIGALNLVGGAATVNFTVSNSRLMLATMPVMGRSHFFALFTVITSLGLGATPILWGLLLDSIGAWQMATGPVVWARYSVYFALSGVMAVAAALYSFRLHEKRHAAPEPPPQGVAGVATA